MSNSHQENGFGGENHIEYQNGIQSDFDVHTQLEFERDIAMEDAYDAIDRNNVFDFISATQYLNDTDMARLFAFVISEDNVEIAHYIWGETGFLPTREILLDNIIDEKYEVAAWAHHEGLIEYDIQDIYRAYHNGRNMDPALWILIDGGVESRPDFMERLRMYAPSLNGYGPEFYDWVMDNLRGG